ncbi:carbamoyl-phosphate synthase large subunit [Geodermatophilus bullaregiensis]|uniref:exosortase/archaeosortase family protein n=1 Tax=Geodermatophilus bullaregiensis TaxID=1564160 RepID=UPI00195C6DAD|nr:exosortase/archaeosortase family protein [Geodermatophilus bullaregiensis]MBM7807192.1 carbamoyl-phosphate synthase large subunit [Geodermatophilus bullaregiensis]
MTAGGLALPPVRRSAWRAANRRLLPVALDLALAAAICVLGFRYLSRPLQVLEAAVLARVLGWTAPGQASGVVPTHVLLFRGDGEIIDAVVTLSCSSVLSVLGLVALTAVVLRGRGLHAVAGLLVAVAALLVLNHGRLLVSALAGLWWGEGALVGFHDWVGTLWNLVATLGGFLLMVWIALPALDRAEQDVEGRHTARRPDSWARPGLGYRAAEEDDVRRGRRRQATLTGLLHRYVYPRRLSAWLAARREAARIDYRLGHLPAHLRVQRIGELVADGLGAHPASLVAVATYEQDPVVLDSLAEAVAARQWEPVTGERVAALRLWARGWLMARGPQDGAPDPAPVPPAGTHVTVPVCRIAVPPVAAGSPTRSSPTPPRRPPPDPLAPPHPATFARAPRAPDLPEAPR